VAQMQLLVVSEDKENWLALAQQIYEKKLNHFIKFEVVAIKPYREAREKVEEKIEREAERLLKKIDDKDYVILCDVGGKSITSLEFSQKILKLQEHFSSRRLTFIIGGAYGVSAEIQKRANEKISLSKMTMNHHVAQLFLLEQIYRAFTILKGIPYHNE
jgi:23S rRNA (pseudouridine1915-N3)-methyltransferase